MNITKLELTHFRCFQNITFTFEKPIIVLVGSNGAGKSSIIEALHYLCYLRSFRSYKPSELIHTDFTYFFIKISVHSSDQTNVLQVGVSSQKKVVKLNDSPVTTYKELLDHYCVVTVTEDDLAIIKEGPDIRRTFIDQMIGLFDYEYFKKVQRCKKIIEQRNAFIKNRSMPWQEYLVWTQQLWDISQQIRDARIHMLHQLSEQVHRLLATYYAAEDLSVSFDYIQKSRSDRDVPEFCKKIYVQEQALGRSLFGAHLDDYFIQFQQRKSRSFASRGQQKLIILLMKIAQIELLIAHKGSAILLLDDFLTDFDGERARLLLSALLNVGVQLIFTSPVSDGILVEHLKDYSVQYIKIDNEKRAVI